MAYNDQDYAFAIDFLASGVHPWVLTGGYLLSESSAEPLEIAAEAIHTAWGTHLMPFVGGYVKMWRTRVEKLSDRTLGVFQADHAGTYNSGEAMPQNVAACASLHSATGGRSGRGRVYISGLLTGHLDGDDPNHFTSAATGDLVSRISALMTIDDIAGTGVAGQLSVHSRLQALFHPVTAVTVDPLVDTQRRRVRD